MDRCWLTSQVVHLYRVGQAAAVTLTQWTCRDLTFAGRHDGLRIAGKSCSFER